MRPARGARLAELAPLARPPPALTNMSVRAKEVEAVCCPGQNSSLLLCPGMPEQASPQLSNNENVPDQSHKSSQDLHRLQCLGNFQPQPCKRAVYAAHPGRTMHKARARTAFALECPHLPTACGTTAIKFMAPLRRFLTQTMEKRFDAEMKGHWRQHRPVLELETSC